MTYCIHKIFKNYLFLWFYKNIPKQLLQNIYINRSGIIIIIILTATIDNNSKYILIMWV